MNRPSFSIAAVERDTGLSKDVLRAWERRYGFPTPQRDANGERVYLADQVERLRLIKRLMEQGHRPGRLIRAPQEALAELAQRRPDPDAPVFDPGLDDLLAQIRRHDAAAFLQVMQQRLVREGLFRFVQDTVAPLTRAVGEAWEDGRFAVYEEHLFTELTKRLLRQAISSLPAMGLSPRVLLTTVADEPHVLGLLMVEALFALEGAQCIPLGTQMPLMDIARAANAHQAHAVALSFSVAFPHRQIAPLLRDLRLALAPEVELWVGGAGVRQLAAQDGVRLLPGFESAVAALQEWRAAHQ